MIKKQRALISVSDKTELAFFAKELVNQRIEILSTGGTLKFLKDAGIPATPVEDLTGFPEILDGRVKTLHPKIHGGLLFRRDKKSHVKEAEKHGIDPIDFVVVNLYPFEKVTSDPKVKFEIAVENIDIGGPSMLRSAAKNFESVTVICDPSDYPRVLSDMKSGGGKVSAALKKELAQKVFQRTAVYDQAIADFFKSRSGQKEDLWDTSKPMPEKITMSYDKVQDLRYGENPHQRSAFYVPSWRKNIPPFEQLHGKELSFNNFLDIEGALDVIREFEEPAACVVKHSNPCGIAEGKCMPDALSNAIECDAMSAFGGIIGINRPCDLKTAQMAFDKLHFFEVFVAPAYEKSALKFLKERKNLRIIQVENLAAVVPCDKRFLQSGLLVQDRDLQLTSRAAFRQNLHFVTKKKMTGDEMEDLVFAFKCVKTVKSNAIVITQGHQTVGIGAGQMSRVDSVEIACRKAGYRTDGGILASDAFFPMPDSIEVAHDYKIRAIIQPGGSIRDTEVIAACDRFGIAMAFTGERHFRH
jgi:phosphoribosylaminoimidazolecarboxamide formyltransferase/IMP cyclohydrolase